MKKNNIEADENLLSEIENAISENYVSKQNYNDMLFDNSLNAALMKSGAKSEKALKGFINKDALTFENGELKGIEGQLKEIKKNHGYLFNDSPSVTGGSHASGMNIDYDSLSDEEYYNLKIKKENN